MAVRIVWDCYEVALLFNVYGHVAGGADISDEDSKLSAVLRNLATRRNISIDDTF